MKARKILLVLLTACLCFSTGAASIVSAATWTLSYDSPVGQIKTLADYNGKLYAGGFTVQSNAHLFVYDGNAWSNLNFASQVGVAVNMIESLRVFNNRLYIGTRVYVGSSYYSRVYTYDGSTFTQDFSTAGHGSCSGIEDLAVHNDQLYAANGACGLGEVFQRIGDNNWASVGGLTTPTGDAARALSSFKGSLYVGTGTGGGAKVWRWSGSAWELSANLTTLFGLNQNGVASLAADSNFLFAGTAGPVVASIIPAFDGAAWTNSLAAVGNVRLSAINGRVWAVTGDGHVYWNNGAWQEYGTVTYSYDLAEYDGYLYAGGSDGLIYRTEALSGTPTRTPIIFIPGLMGSRLYNTVDNQSQEVWANLDLITPQLANPHPLMVLELASDGISPARPDPAYSIFTKPGSDGVLTRLVGDVSIKHVDEDIYDTIFQHFKAKGYTENIDLWFYPYDWRKDLRTSAGGLDTLIQNVLLQTGSQQVYIVSHSLGGLVTRQYIADPQRAAKVKRAVILGTPFLGTPKAFFVLQEGDCIQRFAFLCFPKKQVIKALAPNYPAFYEIMPSQAYFTVKGGGFYSTGQYSDVSGACPECLTFDQTYTPTIAENLNPVLSTSATQFHTGLDSQSSWNGVPVSIIAGKNHSTVVGIRHLTVRDWLSLDESILHLPVYSTAGDETVAYLSVSLANEATGINLRGTASFKAFDSKHGDLVKKDEILQYVDSQLGLSSAQVVDPGSAQNPVVESAVTGAQIVGFGVAAIHTYDGSGSHTGPVEDTSEYTEQAIPGSAYFQQDGMSTVALVGGRTYTITVVPSGLGPVDLTLVRSTFTETITSTLYLGVGVNANSRITLVGDPYVVDTWRLDVTGTGSDIQDLAPTTVITSAAAADFIAPAATVISLVGTLGQNGWYTSPVTVTLSATDNITGTGISRIEYAFSNDRQVRIYTGPFVVDPQQVSVLYAAAVDGMGNIQPSFSLARIGPEKLFLPYLKR